MKVCSGLSGLIVYFLSTIPFVSCVSVHGHVQFADLDAVLRADAADVAHQVFLSLESLALQELAQLRVALRGLHEVLDGQRRARLVGVLEVGHFLRALPAQETEHEATDDRREDDPAREIERLEEGLHCDSFGTGVLLTSTSIETELR